MNGNHAGGTAPRVIAMWSGPRNVSTALMYSFAQRADACVWDEPYYAAWLARTGEPHPMRAEILAAHAADPADVARRITAPAGRPLHYQKHMAHHMTPVFDLSGWFAAATHAFLIRPPEDVLASYAAKYDQASLGLIGYPIQSDFFQRVADRLGRAPPVIRGADIQQRPEAALKALCVALDIAFDPAMLSWPVGPKTYDGVWAPHWYDRVWTSTGFAAPPAARPLDLPPRLARIAEAARPHYELLARHALDVTGSEPVSADRPAG